MLSKLLNNKIVLIAKTGPIQGTCILTVYDLDKLEKVNELLFQTDMPEVIDYNMEANLYALVSDDTVLIYDGEQVYNIKLPTLEDVIELHLISADVIWVDTDSERYIYFKIDGLWLEQ
jgi:hypothetical protein